MRCKVLAYADFNSHAHVERDLYFMSLLKPMVISTHTLTWSVTRTRQAVYKDVVHFNSHAHVERDISFQHNGEYTNHFNSHAHVERDSIDYIAGLTNDISTHTLTWSVTQNNDRQSRNF